VRNFTLPLIEEFEIAIDTESATFARLPGGGTLTGAWAGGSERRIAESWPAVIIILVICSRRAGHNGSFARSDKCSATALLPVFQMLSLNSIAPILQVSLCSGRRARLNARSCDGDPSAPGRLPMIGSLRLEGCADLCF
jgi:hypothetical protein